MRCAGMPTTVMVRHPLEDQALQVEVSMKLAVIPALSMLALVACTPLERGLPDHIETVIPVEITATYRERMVLPAGSTLVATISDVSRQDAPAAIVAEQRLSLDGLTPPYRVTLEVSDPGDLRNSTDRYAARAEIRDSEGKLRFTTDTHHGVLTLGQPASASITMIRVPQSVE